MVVRMFMKRRKQPVEAKIVSETDDFITIRIPKRAGESMLETEKAIQTGLNEAGVLATAAALKRYDTDGKPIIVDGVKMTSVGPHHKIYQTPYGPVEVTRHIYQTSQGGKTFCPLEKEARIVITATPHFAKIVSSKFAGDNTREVVRDLKENHGRYISLCLVQNIAEAVGTISQAAEENWSFLAPEQKVPVKTISIGIDGTCMLTVDGGWRQAMVGTVALYDRKGERLHTTYIGAAPEFGRETFLEKMQKEIQMAKIRYPRALTMGLADGAPSNWEFLERHTEMQILDFYHASEYLTKVADVVYEKESEEREDWLAKVCHRLKHEYSGPKSVIREMAHLAKSTKLRKADREVILGAIQYFRKNQHRMPYALQVSCRRPIGSGVTEAACKVIIKQRLCCSGMKWKAPGASVVISLRTLHETEGRWEQFWQKTQEVGYPDGWEGTCS